MKFVLAAALALVAMNSSNAKSASDESYNTIIAAAKTEGKVVLYAPIDSPAMRPLIEDFNRRYPEVEVEFSDLQTTVLYNRYLSEMAAGVPSADVVWNTPMDLQFKLVQDGYAQEYIVREKDKLPTWASWENKLYAVSLDPAVFVYNKAEISGDTLPQSHAELVRILETNPDPFQGRIVSYDIEKAAGGFMMVVQDLKNFSDFWKIPDLFGKTAAQFPSGSGFMIETVGSGENVFGYNQLGSAASKGAAGNANLGIVYPKDYTVVLARTAFISKAARSPNAAKLLLDYLLSEQAQQIIVDNQIAYALRPEVEGELTLKTLSEKIGADKVRPVKIGPDLLEYLDANKRTEFLQKWQQAVAGTQQ
ncbi:ABC transporter substrate-binding protein [Pseudorhizobium pelagicum]|uniref:Iron ABC transporter substrate-binding protein n=1 Tax=Pseudorhizobium pelagicum TaxID=1509405 RepID=A0A922P2E4_9HYPH|nr:ABC transporter substrate-binding protein [Pseudorhizobium pelagicum]KEQ03692.1 hypothetical protein GV67_12545 [Pseudorhizobium pelagicum]KEQ08252.1 hypothetical protein GV68_02860 [Pseudorhizobium pelagicum]